MRRVFSLSFDAEQFVEAMTASLDALSQVASLATSTIYFHPSAYPPPSSSLAYTVGTCPTCHRDAFEVTTHGDDEPVYLCWFCETGKAATGPTQRLTRQCNACADALPPGAVFCIGCGARVEEPV